MQVVSASKGAQAGAQDIRASSAPGAAGYVFRKEDTPTFPGSPYAPPHPPARRAAYAAIGAWICATATLANATVTVNLQNLAGESQAYVAELSWLPAVYVAVNACANLLLFRARAQFGLEAVMKPLLAIYALVICVQFCCPGFALEVGVRAVCGLASAAVTTLGVYYLLQAVPTKAAPVALLIGLGLVQFGTPLARLLPVDLLATAQWRGQHCLELAIVLATLALTTWLPLPPIERVRQFEALDFLTIALVLPGMLLFCGVVNRGRLAWWTDTPWLGGALAVAIPLLAAALVIEVLRPRPLVQVAWLTSVDVLRFVAVALLMRLALAEQTYGAVGLLGFGGLDDDQMRRLFEWVILAMAGGIAVGVLTLSEPRIPYQVIVAALAIALGAWLDSHASNLTGPEQLYVSQSLVGFGTCLFIGPTLAVGLLKVLRQGPAYLVSVVVVFSITQNVGGLLGSSILGTYQTVRERAHALALSERLRVGDPLVSARLQAGAASLGGVLPDPSLRAQQGGLRLAASVAREANVLAFNDVFRVVFYLSLATALLVASLRVLSAITALHGRRPA